MTRYKAHFDVYDGSPAVKHTHRCAQCRMRFNCKHWGCSSEDSVCDKCFKKIVEAPVDAKSITSYCSGMRSLFDSMEKEMSDASCAFCGAKNTYFVRVAGALACYECEVEIFNNYMGGL